MSRRTKIVATIGPASESPETLRALIDAGVDVCRLNLSHGSMDEHIVRLHAVRTAAAMAGRHVAVLADLPGPKIRAGSFPDGGIELTPGSTIGFAPGQSPSTDERISVDYDDLLTDVKVGDRIILGDGGISLRVVSRTDVEVQAEVESGGRVQGRPGVHIQCEELTLRAPTPEDLVLAEQIAAAGVDYIALSFARSASDLDELRAVVGDRARLLAKVETASALANIAEIAATADAVMVARGDLGIDVALEDVPHMQKQIIRHCVETGTPVITATQMLESMIDAPSPTRAEVSDVANAVFDGTDAVMLSGETAIGHDPALVVRTMARIAERAERDADYRQWGTRLVRVQRRRADRSGAAAEADLVADRITESIAHAAWQAADDVGASTIICCTRSGRCARNMARFRPSARLLGMSPHEATLSALALSWGVEPVAMAEAASTDDMVWYAVERAVAGGLVTVGDTVVVIAGAPDRTTGAAADVLRIVRVK